MNSTESNIVSIPKFAVLLTVMIILSFQPVSADLIYEKSGSISEDGDDKWDSNELDIYTIALFEGESLDVTLTSFGNLELMLCNCDNEEDINDIHSAILYGSGSSDLYLWIDSYSVTSGSFVAPRNMYVNVAIYTMDPNNPSTMSYTFSYNKPMGSRYHYSNTINSDLDSVITEGEYGFHFFELQDESLDIRIKADDSFGVVICDCVALEEVQSLIDTNQNGSGSFFYIITNGDFASLLSITGRGNVSIFIFAFNGLSNSVHYDLYTDIYEGERINDNPRPPNSSSDGSFLGVLLVFGLLLFIGYKLYQRSKRGKKVTTYPYQTTYTQPAYQQSPPQQSYTHQAQSQKPWYEQQGSIYSSQSSPQTDPTPPSAPPHVWCSNCGSKQTGKFCSDCGTQIQ